MTMTAPTVRLLALSCVLALASAASNSTAGTTCFLDQFRSLTPQQAAKQGINFIQGEVQHSFGTVLFSSVLMGVCLLVTFFGEKLFKPVIFLSGFGLASVLSFYGVSTVFNSTGWSNCAVLAIVPAVAGLIVGCTALWALKVAFFLLGGSLGFAGGYYLYFLLHVVFKLTIDTGKEFAHHDVLWWVCVLGCVVLGGLVALKLEHRIIIAVTAVCGACGAAAAFDWLVLVHIDPKLTPQYLSSGDAKPLYAYGQLAGTILLALLGMYTQTKCQCARAKTNDAKINYAGNYHPIPYA